MNKQDLTLLGVSCERQSYEPGLCRHWTTWSQPIYLCHLIPLPLSVNLLYMLVQFRLIWNSLYSQDTRLNMRFSPSPNFPNAGIVTMYHHASH